MVFILLAIHWQRPEGGGEGAPGGLSVNAPSWNLKEGVTGGYLALEGDHLADLGTLLGTYTYPRVGIHG